MALLDSLHVDEPIAKDTAFSSSKGTGGLCYPKEYLTQQNYSFVSTLGRRQNYSFVSTLGRRSVTKSVSTRLLTYCSKS